MGFPAPHPAVELVVARYREDLRWLKRVPGSIMITVYDKSGDPDALNPLPNIGREAHTYLHHMIQRYDTLADITVFVQGKPFDHVPNLHTILRELDEGSFRVDDFRWLGFLIDEDDATGSRLFQRWSKNPDALPLDMEGFSRRVWDRPANPLYVFFPGAHFAVTSETIRSNTVAFYKQALQASLEIRDGAHCFERCWDQVFNLNGIPKEYRQKERPVFFKPIRRLIDEEEGTSQEDHSPNRDS